jgi:hypothetical protein
MSLEGAVDCCISKLTLLWFCKYITLFVNPCAGRGLKAGEGVESSRKEGRGND